jgi:hypothetical protein
MSTDPFEELKSRFPLARETQIRFEFPQPDRAKPRTLIVEIRESESGGYQASISNMDNNVEIPVFNKREDTWDDILKEIGIHAAT